MSINNVISIRTLESFSFYQKIDYFTNSYLGSRIFYKNGVIDVKERSGYVTEYILKLFCYSLKSYNETAYKVLKTKHNNPIVLNESLVLIASKNKKDYDNIWINYANIKSFDFVNDKLNFHFYSGNKLVIDKDHNYFKKQILKINKMKTYLFHVRFYI